MVLTWTANGADAMQPAGPDTVICESKEIGSRSYQMTQGLSSPEETERAPASGTGFPCQTIFRWNATEPVSLEGDATTTFFIGCDPVSTRIPLTWINVSLERNDERLVANESFSFERPSLCGAGDVIEEQIALEDLDTRLEPGDLLDLEVRLSTVNMQPVKGTVYFLVDSHEHPSSLQLPVSTVGPLPASTNASGEAAPGDGSTPGADRPSSEDPSNASGGEQHGVPALGSLTPLLIALAAIWRWSDEG